MTLAPSALLPPQPAQSAVSPHPIRVRDGLSNADIVRRLGISRSCVKHHIDAIMIKLGAANRSEAVAIALRKQLLKI